jgi:hypothetical protein
MGGVLVYGNYAKEYFADVIKHSNKIIAKFKKWNYT